MHVLLKLDTPWLTVQTGVVLYTSHIHVTLPNLESACKAKTPSGTFPTPALQMSPNKKTGIAGTIM